MPTITLNRKVFEKLVGKKLPREQLKDRISMLGTDLEGISGDAIEVEVFPNRPDMLSEQGFARAFSSFIGVKTGIRNYGVKKSGEKVVIDKSVKGIRPFTACALVKGLRFDEEKIREVIQIQEKLHVTYGRNRKKLAAGIYPLEKIKFPIKYLAENPEKIRFQPLEFPKEINGRQVLSQHKAGREFGHLLEGQDKFPVFRDVTGAVLSMPPIINSHLTGKITEKTKDVFIECSGFDLEVLKKCLNIIVTALAEMGGKIYSLELDYSGKKIITPDLTPGQMKLDLAYVNKWLGLELKEKEAVRLLGKMGYGYDTKIKKVLIPAYRADILHQVDLAEDIAVAYGYENFVPEIPQVMTIGEEDPKEKFCRRVREVLAGFGLLELKNYHLMTAAELNEKMFRKGRLVGVKNALGDYTHLRNSILPSLMKNLSENQHNEYPQNLFEIGRTFGFDPKTETGVIERERLGIVLCGETVDFTSVRQVLEGLFSALGLEVRVKEGNDKSFINGRVGEILVEGKKMGVMGEVAPEVLERWGLTMPVGGMEIDLEEVFNLLG